MKGENLQNLFEEFEKALTQAGVVVNQSGQIILHFDSAGDIKKIEERFSLTREIKP